MSALLFPGQGSQVVGMGNEFYNNFNIVKEIFKKADDKLNFSISKIILEGPEDKLQLTKNTQPAILTVSFSIFEVLRKEFNLDIEKFKYFAGHSLGEYSALVCSNAINFEDAIYLLHERGKAMQEAVPLGEGGMVAVLGAKIEKINELVQNIKNNIKVCEIANDNSDGQVILSGDIKSINLFKTILKENKIKTVPLKVSAPFHCSLMKPAAEHMKEKINKIHFNKPKIEIVNNVTSNPVNDPAIIKKLLIDQIFSTVRWRESMINISKKGITNYVEIGPGKVLINMVKRTLKNINCFSVNSIDDIKKLGNEFKK